MFDEVRNKHIKLYIYIFEQSYQVKEIRHICIPKNLDSIHCIRGIAERFEIVETEMLIFLLPDRKCSFHF